MQEKPPLPLAEKPKDLEAKRILETPLEETAAPDKADFLGQTNHKAKKETVRRIVANEKALDPGRSVKQAKAMQAKQQAKNLEVLQQKRVAVQAQKRPMALEGQSAVPKSIEQADFSYKDLLANSQVGMVQQAVTGYEEYLKGVAEEAGAVDLNTQEYRYIGYFTTLRKAIELVWIYPTVAARQGFQGKVAMKFTINKDGTLADISVLNSSGYRVLDDSIVQAISLAAPFSPLPKEMSKEKLVVTGTFSYILSAY